ncbi:hypothetical protein [Serratia fonticola]
MDYTLNYNDAITYTDAMEYLIRHFAEFPKSVPPGGLSKNISVEYFNRHRFVKTLQGEVVFADCIIPGITAQDFNEYRQKVTLCQGDNHG